METNGRNHFGLWQGVMVGSFLGAAAGFLLAPTSGKELRSGIRDRTNKTLDATKRFYSEGYTKFRDTMAFFTGRKESPSASHVESPEEIVADA